MIPTLICPVISRFDLLERMLASIDYPVETLIIVDNSCSGYVIPEDKLPSIEILPNVPEYIRPISGLGWGGGINAGILQHPQGTYWMWTSNDLTFGPGDLESIHNEMLSDIQNVPKFVSYGFIYAALNRACVREVGLVDEYNFPAIYMDDIDYYRRLRLAKVKVVDYLGGIQHGADGHKASLTINSSPEFKRKNSATHEANWKRYVEKWNGEPGHETYTTPFGSGQPLWSMQPDLDRRAEHQW